MKSGKHMHAHMYTHVYTHMYTHVYTHVHTFFCLIKISFGIVNKGFLKINKKEPTAQFKNEGEEMNRQFREFLVAINLGKDSQLH